MDETTDLTHLEFRTAIWIMRYQGRNEWAYPSYTALAEKLGMKRRRIIQAIQSLEQKQIIEVGRRKGRINRYRIIEKRGTSAVECTPAQTSTSAVQCTGALQDTNPCTPVHPPVHSSAPPSEAYSEKQTQEADSLERVCTPAASLGETRQATATAPLDTRYRGSLPTPTHDQEKAMSKAHIGVIRLILNYRLDPSCADDPAFTQILDGIKDEDWSEDHPALDPWRTIPSERKANLGGAREENHEPA